MINEITSTLYEQFFYEMDCACGEYNRDTEEAIANILRNANFSDDEIESIISENFTLEYYRYKLLAFLLLRDGYNCDTTTDIKLFLDVGPYYSAKEKVTDNDIKKII